MRKKVINSQDATLDSIRDRKEDVLEAIRKDRDSIADKWNKIMAPPEINTKGERIINMIDNTMAIYDGTMLGLKMMHRFRGFFSRKRR